MMQDSQRNDYRLTLLKQSLAAIASAVFVEVILGLAVGSLAILSDGLHAFFDALTTVVLFFAMRASLKPPDEEHMYGHEKFESIGGLIGGIALIGTALLVVYEAVLRILNYQTINEKLQYIGWVAIGYTFCVDFFRVRTLTRVSRSESSTMKAGFYHAISDMGSTVIALLGFGLATLGFSFGDSLASVILGTPPAIVPER
jgi:cation diffusion facilitator family transporter